MTLAGVEAEKLRVPSETRGQLLFSQMSLDL